MARIRVGKKGTIPCNSNTAREAVDYLRQVLNEPWHGNVLLSCGPHKLEEQQQLSEFNADLVFTNYSFLSSGPPIRIAATELRGITVTQLSALLVFVQEIADSWCDAHHLAYGQPLSFEAFNLYHANFWVIEPATAGHGRGGCSYVELVATEGPKQRPLWFVSHAWLEPVCSFVACLKRHAALRQLSDDTAYWVCAYANNQHQLQDEICQNPRKTSFYRAIKNCCGVLLVLDQNATPFTRIWCCFEESIAVEERNNGTCLLLDVAATENGRAHVITDGLAGAEQQMMPLLGFLTKSQREADFPTDLLMKGLNVDIASAMASEASDKRKILNSIALPRAGTTLLQREAQANHDSYHAVGRALAGHFALANWFSSVASGRDTSRLLTALENDVQRRAVQLSLTGCCQFDAAQLTSFLEHLPAQLQVLRLDLGFTAVERLDFVAMPELQELSLRVTRTPVHQVQLQKRLMPKLRSLQLWLSNLPCLEDLRLDLAPCCCAAKLHELVLHVHSCPKLAKATKQELYDSLQRWCHGDKWISLEGVEGHSWFQRFRRASGSKDCKPKPLAAVPKLNMFFSGSSLCDPNDIREAMPFPCSAKNCMEFHNNLHGFCHQHRWKRFERKVVGGLTRACRWVELIFLLSVQAAAEIQSRVLLLLVLLSLLPMTCICLEQSTGMSASFICVTILLVALGSCFYTAKRLDSMQEKLFKLSLATEASYFQVLQSTTDASEKMARVSSILGSPSNHSSEMQNDMDIRSNFQQAQCHMGRFQSVCTSLRDAGEISVKLKSPVEVDEGTAALDILYCEVVCDSLQQVQQAWQTLKNLDVTIVSAYDFFAMASPQKRCEIVVSLDGYLATIFLMDRSLRSERHNEIHDAANWLGLLDRSANWEVSRLQSGISTVPRVILVLTTIFRFFAFGSSLANAWQLSVLWPQLMQQEQIPWSWSRSTAAALPFWTCAAILLWDMRYCCCCCCCRCLKRRNFKLRPRPTQIWYRNYLGVHGSHYAFKVAALQLITVLLQTFGKANIFGEIKDTFGAVTLMGPDVSIFMALLLCNIIFPALVFAFPHFVFTRVGAAVMDVLLDLGYLYTTLQFYNKLPRKDPFAVLMLENFWSYMSVYICIAHVVCVCKSLEAADWVKLFQAPAASSWGLWKRLLFSMTYVCALLAVVALLLGDVFTGALCPPCECSILSPQVLRLDRCMYWVPEGSYSRYSGDSWCWTAGKYADAIDLAGKGIGELSPGAFHPFYSPRGRCYQIITTNLHLESNSLTTVAPAAFEGMRVQRLHLQNNDLAHLNSQSFRGLKFGGLSHEIAQLDLSRNKLQTLPPKVFDFGSNFSALQILNLAHNELSILPAKAFQGLWIDNLKLEGNRLQRLPAGLFSKGSWRSSPNGPSYIKELNLEENELLDLDEEVFSLRGLKYLKLGRNKLTWLPNGIFKDLRDLQRLQLQGNRLRLQPRLFQNLSDLQMLNLSRNDMAEFPSGLFSGLVNLKILDLSQNRLRSLNATEFSGLPQLETLDLRGNHLPFGTQLKLQGLKLKELKID